jgi:hypothetical protein
MNYYKIATHKLTKWDVQHWGFGSLDADALPGRAPPNIFELLLIHLWFFLKNLRIYFLGGASPGSAGCFKNATQTPNARHPI